MKSKFGKIAMRCLAFLLAISLAVAPVHVRAEETEQVTGGVAWTLVDGVLTISPATTPEEGYVSGQMRTDYENNSANGVPWFDDMETITTLVVESGVTHLGNRVCNGASLLTSVSLPEGLTTIGERSFSSCKVLANISLPNSLTYLGPYAFTACKELTVVDLSNTQISSLGTKAFAGCEKLTTLSIPGTVTSIAENAFGIQSEKPTNLLTRVNYGGTLATWNNGAFVDTTGNTNLTNGTCTVYCTDGIWASGYTSSGTNMCYKLTGGTLTIRCDGAMPDYDQGAAPWYGDASSITNVVLENGITYIGANAFYGCNALSHTYSGDFEVLKTESSKVGNTALFGEKESEGGESGDDTTPEEQVTGGVAWTLVDGVLTISPATTPEEGYVSGQMCTDYTSNDSSVTVKKLVPWFDDMSKIKTVIVADGVINLGNRLFNGASGLTSVSFLSDDLTSIGSRCFSGCISLTSISLPDSITTIGDTAFNNCDGLVTVDISNTKITEMAKKTFSACSNLTTISLPVITKIGESCFGASNGDETNQLTKVNFAGTGAQWSAITVVTTGDGAGQTYNKQLLKCTVFCTDGEFTLDENYDVIIPAPDEEPEENVTGGVVWNLSEDGTTLTISPATTPETGYNKGAMPDYAEGKAPWTEAVSTITTVVFEDGIVYVGSNAFPGETKLSCNYTDEQLNKLKTDSSKTGNTALFGEEESEGGESGDDTTPEEQVTGGVKWTLVDGVLTISPATTPESGYTSGQMRTDYENNSQNGVPWFDDMSTITSMIVESGVTNLGNRLCNGASGLTSVSLPSGLTSIGERCFVGCTSLENITLPDSLVSLGAYSFTGCTKLTVVDLSNTQITTLGAKTFAGCGALTTLSIPETVTGKDGIASNVFCDYASVDTNKLTRLNYEGSLATWNSFEYRAHKDNPNLANGTCTVYCKDGVWNANYISVDNLCYKLEDGVLSILCNGPMPDYTEGAAPWFAKASEITTVIFEDGTTTVGANAFDGCVNLTDVTICAGVTKVGENAFFDCVNLANVHFYGTPTQWTALQNASGTGNGPLFSVTITSGYSGRCGDNARWEYDQSTKTLTISGTGPMWDWNQRTYLENTPWSKFKDEIETIKIGYGITNTGRYAFCYMSALKNLEFLTNEDGFTTVETIGGYCFCWENQLTTLTLPEGVRFIAGRAFSRCESVATLYLPSTLESIDMYAFQSNDNSVIINKVYYNGTKEDWDRKVYVSTQGDGHDQLYSQNTEWVYLKDYTYYDDVSDQNWYADAVYYLKDQGMAPEGTSFGVEAAAAMDWVLDALYIRAGSSGAYVDALDWAKSQTIVAADTTADVGVSLNALADILYRTSLYNGHLADLGEGTALAWCQAQGYIPAQLDGQAADAALNRAQAASVLAEYLQSSNGSANRYDKMRDEMKAAYETGGDSKMHILALHHAGTGKFGDCTLILMPGGELMLIDTFRNDGWKNYLKATLDSLGVKKLDYLVLSHGHDDHDANLDDVINYIYDNGYTIDNYWSASSTTSTRETAAVALLQEKGGVNIQNRLRAGAQLTIGSGSNQVAVDILWPTASGISGDTSGGNDGSLTMKLTYGDSSYICGGDLFLTAEEDILKLHKDNLDILKADVMKTNHHGSYSSNGSDWVAAVDPMAMITYSDDSGDSSQCYEYSRDGRAWFAAGRDGGILVVMDSKKNITVTTGYDTNLRQNIYACGEKGHIYDGQAWEFDENGHWRKCEGFWLCGAMEPVLAHAGGTANCQHGKICEICGFEYTEKGTHNWVYSAEDNVITATCGTCQTPGGTLTLEIADATSTYDGTAKTVTVSGSIDGVQTPDVTYTGDQVNVGTFTAAIQIGNAKAELTVTIGKRNVTVTAKDQTITYGSTISSTEITSVGLVNGHSVTVTLIPNTENVTVDGSITARAAVITADNLDVTANYEINYAGGKLVIEPDTSKLGGLTTANVTSANEADILAVQETMRNAESIKEEWKAIATTCEDLIEKIKTVETENIRIADAVSEYDLTSVNSSDETAIIQLISDIDAQLATGNLTDEEKTELVGLKTKCNNLIGKIDGTESLVGQLDKVLDDLNSESVKSTDKAKLEQVIADAQTLFDSGNVTDAEKETLKQIQKDAQALIKVIDDTAAAKKKVVDEAGTFNAETVKSTDKVKLEQLAKDIDALLDADNLTEDERKTLEDTKKGAEALIAAIDAVQDATDTENTEKVENVTADNVKPEDREALIDAKADLEKALKDNAVSYTEEEKNSIQKEIQRIEDALEVISNVNVAEAKIAALPKTAEPDDEKAVAAVEAAKKAYATLTDYEKSLVSKESKEALEKLSAAIVDYKIVKGDGGIRKQESNDSLSLTANGLFSKFVYIEVDGKKVDAKHYEAKSGSTIITMKDSYLDTLSAGTHTITVVYTDGKTDGTFHITAKAVSPTTGDSFNVMLWTTVMLLSVMAMVLLIGYRRRFIYKGKYGRD